MVAIGMNKEGVLLWCG